MHRDDLAGRLLATFVAELDEQVSALNAELLELEGAPDEPDRIRSLFRIAHTIKGAARVAGVPLIERAFHQLEALFAAVRDGELELGPTHFRVLFAAADALAEAGRRLRADEELSGSPLEALLPELHGLTGGEVRPARPPPRDPGAADVGGGPAAPAGPALREPGVAGTAAAGAAEAPIRVPPERLDALFASSVELRTAAGRIGERPRELTELNEFAHGWAAQWRRLSWRVRQVLEASGAPPATLNLIRDSEERLASLVQRLGGLARHARDDARTLSRLTEEISRTVRELRLRPFQDACEALPRAVRDVAASGGKEAVLELSGQEVEADRAVVDVLREPLLHLVRNAVDHGIEPPAQREAANKPRQGQVRVAAAVSAGRLQVEVSDDGAGLDLAAIRDFLRARDGEAPDSDQEVVRRLFHGGVSTRRQATEISGRGVGLELVRWSLERIGGSVDVDWTPGVGTTFRLEVPQNAATARTLLFEVGSELVAIPSAHVERLRRVAAADLKRVEGALALTGSDGPVPIRTLAGILGPPRESGEIVGSAAVAILVVGRRRLAVVVDRFAGEEELLVRSLPANRGAGGLVTGGALLPTGRIAVVLSAAGLVARGLAAAGEPRIAAVETAAPRRRRVLVVDDSMTTRTLEQSVLEAAGFDVLTAADGEAGWRTLQEEGADLVVADVEMPRMDGFALCEAIRGSQRFRELPVILVTALEQPEHRERGLQAGADAYLPKSSFDQETLLATIRELLE